MRPIEGVVVVGHDVPLNHLAVHDSFGGWQLHRVLHDLCHDGVQVVIRDVDARERGLLGGGQLVEALHELLEVLHHIFRQHAISLAHGDSLREGLRLVIAAVLGDHGHDPCLVLTRHGHVHLHNHLQDLFRLEVVLVQVGRRALGHLQLQAPGADEAIQTGVQAVVKQLLKHIELADDDHGGLTADAPERPNGAVPHLHVRLAVLPRVSPAAAVEICTITCCLVVLSELLLARPRQCRLTALLHQAADLDKGVEALLQLHGRVVHHLIQELEELIRVLRSEPLQRLLVGLQRQHLLDELHDRDAELVLQLHPDVVVGPLGLLHGGEDPDAPRHDVIREHRGVLQDVKVVGLRAQTHEDRRRLPTKVGVLDVVARAQDERDEEQEELRVQVREELRSALARWPDVDAVLEDLNEVLEDAGRQHGPLR
mmetsp:Transcript_38960/g.115480  ORF Transcript_38960/g.115480 Transcript_38960/m.115480 type:complete len:426 (+) Transcript_38960:222-1499(+)